MIMPLGAPPKIQNASFDIWMEGFYELLKRFEHDLSMQKHGFSAYKSSDTTNATGDGTAYTLIANTEIFDDGGGYNASTGVFTCSVPGKYTFNATVSLANIDSGHTDMAIYLIQYTGAAWVDVQTVQLNPYAVSISGVCSFSISSDFKLATSDTVQCTITILGGTKTVTISGGTPNSDPLWSRFSGQFSS